MNVGDLIKRFRSDVRDDAGGQLWTDPEIIQNLDDAQRMFCRLVGGIADSISGVTKVSAQAGTEYVQFDPRILKIRYVRRASDGREVTLLNFEDLQRSKFVLDTRQGKIEAVVTGMHQHRGRLVYIPDVADTLLLTVYRYPLNPLAAKGDEPEIDEQHHLHLLLWVKHLGYSKQDAETYNRQKAIEFEGLFRQYCERARQERDRLEHKYRTVEYGGY